MTLNSACSISLKRGKSVAFSTLRLINYPSGERNWGPILLAYSDLEIAKNLRKIFEQLEDGLHNRVVDKSKRFTVLLQLLLAKLYDEQTHQSSKETLEIQDYSVSSLKDASVKGKMDAVLAKACKFYGKYLPEPVPDSFKIDGAALKQVTKLLAPLNILSSRRDVMQDFYMYFAKGLYKWELAQYFTPTEVVDCVINVLNPQQGEHAKDPACGSADFLISVFRWGADHSWNAADSIWGADNSHQAVQVSVLNMLLNGMEKVISTWRIPSRWFQNMKTNLTCSSATLRLGRKSRTLCPTFSKKVRPRS